MNTVCGITSKKYRYRDQRLAINKMLESHNMLFHYYLTMFQTPIDNLCHCFHYSNKTRSTLFLDWLITAPIFKTPCTHLWATLFIKCCHFEWHFCLVISVSNKSLRKISRTTLDKLKFSHNIWKKTIDNVLHLWTQCVITAVAGPFVYKTILKVVVWQCPKSCQILY